MKARTVRSKEAGVILLTQEKSTEVVETHESRELRRRPRANYCVEGRLEVVGVTLPGGGVFIETRDVSEIGAGLLSTESVPTAATVLLSIAAPCGTRLCVHGSVVRLCPLPNGEFEVGVRFYDEQPLLSARRIDAAMYGR